MTIQTAQPCHKWASRSKNTEKDNQHTVCPCHGCRNQAIARLSGLSPILCLAVSKRSLVLSTHSRRFEVSSRLPKAMALRHVYLMLLTAPDQRISSRLQADKPKDREKDKRGEASQCPCRAPSLDQKCCRRFLVEMGPRGKK